MSTPSSYRKPAPSPPPPPPEDNDLSWALGLFGVDEMSPFDGPLDVLPKAGDRRHQDNVGDDAWIPEPPVVREHMDDDFHPASPPAADDVPESPLGPRMDVLAGGGFDIEKIKALLPELASTELPDYEASVPAAEMAGQTSSEKVNTSRSPRIGMDEMVVTNIFEDLQLGQWGTEERIAAELDIFLRNSPKNPNCLKGTAPTNTSSVADSIPSIADNPKGPGRVDSSRKGGGDVGGGSDCASTAPRFGANTVRPKHFTSDEARRKAMKTRSKKKGPQRLSGTLNQDNNVHNDNNPPTGTTCDIPCGFSQRSAPLDGTSAPTAGATQGSAAASENVRTCRTAAAARGNAPAARRESAVMAKGAKKGRRYELVGSKGKRAVSTVDSPSLTGAVRQRAKTGTGSPNDNGGVSGGGSSSVEKKKPPPEKKSARAPTCATAIVGGEAKKSSRETRKDPKKAPNNNAGLPRVKGGNGAVVPEYDIYGFEDRSLQAECMRQALLDLTTADMERVQKERTFSDAEQLFISSRYSQAEAHDRWVQATMSVETISRAASVPFMQERQALAAYEKAQREKRAADSGVVEAQASSTSANARVKQTMKIFDVKVAAKAEAERRLGALDAQVRGVGLGGVMSVESSGDLKRRRGGDEDDHDISNDIHNEQLPSASRDPAVTLKSASPATKPGRLEQHRRPLRSILTKTDADQAMAQGSEADRELKRCSESQAAELTRQAESKRSALEFALHIAASDTSEGERVAKDAAIMAGRARVELEAARQAFGVPEATRDEARAGRVHRETVKAAEPFVMWVNREVAAQKHLFEWNNEMRGRSKRAWETREVARQECETVQRKVQRAMEVLSGFPGYKQVIGGFSQHNLFKFMVEDRYQKEKRSQAFTAGPERVHIGGNNTSSSSSSGGGGISNARSNARVT